jgi:hypothetical protein
VSDQITSIGDRVRQRTRTAIGATLVAAAALVASACAPALPPPVDASDIAVIELASDNAYLTAALTKDGSVAVAPVRCQQATCNPGAWTSLGGNLTSLQLETLDESSKSVIVIGLAPSRSTWFKRGTCGPSTCSWDGWTKLGGNLSTVRADHLVGTRCVLLAGKTWLENVFEAKICSSKTEPWTYAHGRVSEIAVDGGAPGNGSRVDLFGAVRNFNYARVRGAGWNGLNASLVDPVVAGAEWCGLSSSGRLWCSNTPYRNNFRLIGGTWAKLDGGTTIGLAADGSVMDWNGSGIANYGGNMTQVAADQDLAVAITTDGIVQFRRREAGAGPWQDLSAP